MRKRIFSCTIHYIPVRIVIRFTLSALEAGYFSSPERCISIAAALARPAVARDLSGSVRMCPVFLGKPCPVLSGPAGNFAPECRHDIAPQSRCQPAALGFFLTPMRPPDPEQPHRTATVLELFLDLVFVVDVSTVGVQLHHALTEGHAGKGIGLYFMVFFTIWWAWMNFTWFATRFNSDDWLYRLSTFVQTAGVLVLTAGISDVFEDRDFSIMVIGYVIMRVAMEAQWLRASRAKGRDGHSALTYAIGILSAQVLWVISAVVTSGRIPL